MTKNACKSMKLPKYPTWELKSINKFQPMVSPHQLQRSKAAQLLPNFRSSILLSNYYLKCVLSHTFKSKKRSVRKLGKSTSSYLTFLHSV